MTSEEKDMGSMYWHGMSNKHFFPRKTWGKEYIRDVKTCANGSNIAEHAWSFGHCIDSCVIDKKTLEAWHTFAISMLTIILRRFQASKIFFLLYSYYLLYYYTTTIHFDNQSWQVVFLFLVECILKEIENTSSVFLLSYRNTRKSLGELEKAVETLACG